MLVIQLKTAIKRGDKNEITRVELREPSAGELRGLKLLDVVAMDVNALVELLPRITTPSLSPIELRAMNLVDFTELAKGIGEFFSEKEEFPAA
ncbi:phage tail assembly protein [Dichelobacter nodosus]